MAARAAARVVHESLGFRLGAALNAELREDHEVLDELGSPSAAFAWARRRVLEDLPSDSRVCGEVRRMIDWSEFRTGLDARSLFE